MKKSGTEATKNQIAIRRSRCFNPGSMNAQICQSQIGLERTTPTKKDTRNCKPKGWVIVAAAFRTISGVPSSRSTSEMGSTMTAKICS